QEADRGALAEGPAPGPETPWGAEVSGLIPGIASANPRDRSSECTPRSVRWGTVPALGLARGGARGRVGQSPEAVARVRRPRQAVLPAAAGGCGEPRPPPRPPVDGAPADACSPVHAMALLPGAHRRATRITKPQHDARTCVTRR